MKVTISRCPKCGKEFKRRVDKREDNKNYTMDVSPEYYGACWAEVRNSPEQRLLEAVFGGGVNVR